MASDHAVHLRMTMDTFSFIPQGSTFHFLSSLSLSGHQGELILLHLYFQST